MKNLGIGEFAPARGQRDPTRRFDITQTSRYKEAISNGGKMYDLDKEEWKEQSGKLSITGGWSNVPSPISSELLPDFEAAVPDSLSNGSASVQSGSAPSGSHRSSISSAGLDGQRGPPAGSPDLEGANSIPAAPVLNGAP